MSFLHVMGIINHPLLVSASQGSRKDSCQKRNAKMSGKFQQNQAMGRWEDHLLK